MLATKTLGVLFFRPDGRVHYAFERMTGYAVHELRSGPHWKTLMPPEFWDVTTRAASELAQRGETAPYKKQFIRKNCRHERGGCQSPLVSSSRQSPLVLALVLALVRLSTRSAQLSLHCRASWVPSGQGQRLLNTSPA